ncbi:hypothetical protein V8C35DRAFT_310034 [Trichoderma chlorosporum]
MYEHPAAAMKAAVASLRSPEISAQAPSRPKRKWANDSDDASSTTTTTSAARPRARLETGKGVEQAIAMSSSTDSASAAASTPSNPRRLPEPTQDAPVPVAVPPAQPQTYPDSQQNNTHSSSGHSSVAQDSYAETAYGHGDDVMPPAYSETMAYNHYSTALPPSTTFSPHPQQVYWSTQGQSGDAFGHPHLPPVPSSSPPQPVSLQMIQANGAVYPVHPQVLVLNQSLIYSQGPAQYNFPHQLYPPSHHFQQIFFQQATEQLPLQSLQTYHYSGPASQHPPYIGGVGQVSSTHRLAPISYHLGQPPTRQFPIISPMDNSQYPGSAEASGSDYAQDGSLYEHHTQMPEITDWLKLEGYDEPADHETDAENEEGMSDASGISDVEIPCDAHDEQAAKGDLPGAEEDSSGASEEKKKEDKEPEPSSSVKKEDAASSTTAPKPKRGKLSPANRKQTAETRNMKACTRCRMQKMRCHPDPADPAGDCIGCKTFSKTSKKTIHRMPCYRGKITDAVLFRKGGLELTKRWKDGEMKDVADRPHPKDIRTILITLGICKEPIEVKVVAFKPQPGDVTARFWMDGEQGVRKKKDLAHYCLANIQKTAAYFEEYIKKNAVDVMWNERAGGSDQPRDIIEQTYAYVIRHFQLLRRKHALPGKEERELNILGNLFILWFAMRHSTGSSWIQGKETLGMKPETRDETYPLYKRVSVPRMIIAQFDSINYTRIMSKCGKFVLSELESLMSRYQPEYFFLVYACLFILLREASCMSADRYRHARNNYGRSVRYSVPQFVESLHDSCNNLLQHWHYYNAKSWPKPSEAGDRFKTHLADVDADEYDLMMQALTDPAVQKQLDIWRRFKAENGQMSQPAPSNVGGSAYEGRQVFYDWDHPFYWVSQLFEEDWQPHATYRAELIDPLVI